MPILATYNPQGNIVIKASALCENLGDDFRSHIVEQKDPRFVYAIARAVTADVPNKNHDMFPLDEIKRAYTTFIGRNIFLDHNTKSVRNAVGKIIAAELREDEEGHTYVACLFKVDRELHPDIARKIENGIIDSVSMGANVQEAECSKCGQRASREADFCDHMKNMYMYSDVYSINHGVEFTELSLVSVPADPTAHMHKVFNMQNGMTKVAVSPEAPATDLSPKAGGEDPVTLNDVPLEEAKTDVEKPNQSAEQENEPDPIIIQPDPTTLSGNTRYYQIDCSSNETADLIYNILSPFINKGIDELSITGRGIKAIFDTSVKDVEKFMEECIKMHGLLLGKGIVSNAAFESYLQKEAATKKIQLSADGSDFTVTFELHNRAERRSDSVGFTLKILDIKKSGGEISEEEKNTALSAILSYLKALNFISPVRGDKSVRIKAETVQDAEKLFHDNVQPFFSGKSLSSLATAATDFKDKATSENAKLKESDAILKHFMKLVRDAESEDKSLSEIVNIVKSDDEFTTFKNLLPKSKYYRWFRGKFDGKLVSELGIGKNAPKETESTSKSEQVSLQDTKQDGTAISQVDEKKEQVVENKEGAKEPVGEDKETKKDDTNNVEESEQKQKSKKKKNYVRTTDMAQNTGNFEKDMKPGVGNKALRDSAIPTKPQTFKTTKRTKSKENKAVSKVLDAIVRVKEFEEEQKKGAAVANLLYALSAVQAAKDQSESGKEIDLGAIDTKDLPLTTEEIKQIVNAHEDDTQFGPMEEVSMWSQLWDVAKSLPSKFTRITKNVKDALQNSIRNAEHDNIVEFSNQYKQALAAYYNPASQEDFRNAVDFLNMIPEDTYFKLEKVNYPYEQALKDEFGDKLTPNELDIYKKLLYLGTETDEGNKFLDRLVAEHAGDSQELFDLKKSYKESLAKYLTDAVNMLNLDDAIIQEHLKDFQGVLKSGLRNADDDMKKTLAPLLSLVFRQYDPINFDDVSDDLTVESAILALLSGGFNSESLEDYDEDVINQAKDILEDEFDSYRATSEDGDIAERAINAIKQVGINRLSDDQLSDVRKAALDADLEHLLSVTDFLQNELVSGINLSVRDTDEESGKNTDTVPSPEPEKSEPEPKTTTTQKQENKLQKVVDVVHDKVEESAKDLEQVSKLDNKEYNTVIGKLKFSNPKINGMDVREVQSKILTESGKLNLETVQHNLREFSRVARVAAAITSFFSKNSDAKEDMTLSIHVYFEPKETINLVKAFEADCSIVKSSSGEYTCSGETSNSPYGDASAKGTGTSAGDSLSKVLVELQFKLSKVEKNSTDSNTQKPTEQKQNDKSETTKQQENTKPSTDVPVQTAQKDATAQSGQAEVYK